jgi:hypothetical protein
MAKKTTKRTAKKSSKAEKFEPSKMSFAVAAAAVSCLVLIAALMVQ